MKESSYKAADLHTHTNFAYCSENVTPEGNIKRAAEKGLGMIAFTEHAGQLYVSSKDYWAGKFIDDTGIMAMNRETPLNRMPDYRRTVEKFRSPQVLVGVEAEVDCNGRLTLFEEDMDCWDIVVGAVHFLPAVYEPGSEAGFMWANEMLLRAGVDVLAHPFRYFQKKKKEVPKHLFRPLAEMLAQYGAAAELNFHKNENDPLFYEECLKKGVRISFGSDAHNLDEVGAFEKYYSVMEMIIPFEQPEQAGKIYEKILYRGRRVAQAQ